MARRVQLTTTNSQPCQMQPLFRISPTFDGVGRSGHLTQSPAVTSSNCLCHIQPWPPQLYCSVWLAFRLLFCSLHNLYNRTHLALFLSTFHSTMSQSIAIPTRRGKQAVKHSQPESSASSSSSTSFSSPSTSSGKAPVRAATLQPTGSSALTAESPYLVDPRPSLLSEYISVF